MSRNNPSTWGLKVPGRPPTPSEGYAQQYDRIGPVESQKLWTFDNGTCLTYGPDDLVDEFDPVMHPFCNQIALIDTLVRECRTVRARYESTAQAVVNKSESSASDKATEDDPFNDFRTVLLDPQTLPQVVLDSGVYLQTPSRHASVSNLVSVYSSINKSDVPGEAHKGVTNDTRFGMCGKPAFGSLQQHIQRQDNIHKLKAQPSEQEGLSGKHRGRRFRKVENDRPHFQSSNSRVRGGQNGTIRGNYGRSQSTNGHRDQSGINSVRPFRFHHQRFKSQDEISMISTPCTTVSFPNLDGDQTILPPDYEDEGPLLYTPAPVRYQRERFRGLNFVPQTRSIVGGSRGISPFGSDTSCTEAVRRSRAYSIQRAFSEGVIEGGTASTQRAIVSRTKGITNIVGVKQLAEVHDLNGQVQQRAGYPLGRNNTRNTKRNSASKGAPTSEEPGIAVQPPTPAHAMMNRPQTMSTSPGDRDKEEDEWEADNDRVASSHLRSGIHTRSNVFDVIQAANLRAAHGLAASARGLSPAGSGSDSGHLSEPSRSRPRLLSPFQFAPAALPSGDQIIFRERAGKVSREPSPDEGGSRGPRCRLYEQ